VEFYQTVSITTGIVTLLSILGRTIYGIAKAGANKRSVAAEESERSVSVMATTLEAVRQDRDQANREVERLSEKVEQLQESLQSGEEE